jgi:two-component system sensor histidine kinase KdpD
MATTTIFGRYGRSSQIIFSLLTVILVSAICFGFEQWLDYKIVAFILLVTVSALAVLFDILPVLLSAILSALIWNFFFIAPRFTFRIGTIEDGVLFSMYFLVAIINAILTNRIKQVEKQARQKEEKARSIQLYNTLFNTLSHELKTPIAAIIAAIDNLRENQNHLDKKQSDELLFEISRASLRLNQQVGNLLNMSRLESGTMKPKKDWADINELIHSVVNRLESNLQKFDVHISIEEDLPFYYLDYMLIEQALYNLVGNASIYTPEYSELFISAKNNSEKTYRLSNSEEDRAITSETHTLVLTVEDRGPGFPENEISRVFDRFYRLKNSKAGGTGLGLSIVKGFVEAHGGHVTLENIPHGARFIMEIPAPASFMNSLKNE